MTTETPKTFFEKASDWIKHSLGLKMFTIGFLIIILLIPTELVENLIRERKGYQSQVVSEVSQTWGNAQCVSAFVLTVPVVQTNFTTNKEGEKTAYETRRLAHFVPEELNIVGAVLPEKRNRGIYDITIYEAQLKINGNFAKPSFNALNLENIKPQWDQAYISMGLSDNRGIQNNLQVVWNKESLPFEPGTKDQDVFGAGVHASVPMTEELEQYTFSAALNIHGSSNLTFSPTGKRTKVSLTSKWPDPSFSGAFLPDAHEISAEGFKANWDVLDLNRNFPHSFVGEERGLERSAFGVKLFVPAGQYQQNMRAVKYALLLITLTFLVYFILQVRTKSSVHPVQYILIGLAVCIFFALLLAISEHLSFGKSYLISALAVIMLIALYGHFIFRNAKITAAMAGLLAIFYGFIYLVLQLEDYALLAGTLGMFCILAILMVATKKIDWTLKITHLSH